MKLPIAYYGSPISPHMTETPEGFLICHDVPLNRVGVYDYLGSELGLTGEDSTKFFKVLRRPEQVFDKATLASFEGKTVTDDHPPEDITVDNVNRYERGHAENVHKGTGQWDGHTIGDLMIKDPDLIKAVKGGKREISCGYNYKLYRNPNGTLEQREIRGNHIAIVEKGRAGSRVAIRDSKPNNERGNTMKDKNGSVLGRIYHMFAKDENTTPEDMEAVVNLLNPQKAVDEAPEDEPEKPKEAAPEEAKDETPNEIKELLTEVLTRLKTLEAKGEAKDEEDPLENIISSESHEEHEQGETPAEEMQEKAGKSGDPADTEKAVVVSPEDIQVSRDAAAKIAKSVQTSLKKAYAKDPKGYKLAAMDAAAAINKACGVKKDNGAYANIIRATQAAAKNAHDAAPTPQEALAQVQAAYDARNPHKKEVK